MKRCSTAFVVITFLASLCPVSGLNAIQTPAKAQALVGSNSSPDANNVPPATIATPSPFLKGTNLVAEFSQSLNVRKVKPGDKVRAVLTQDLLIKGRIVAPVDSRLVGHVTMVKLSTEADPESELGVVFDKVLVKHHQELALQAGVQALLPPVIHYSRVDRPDQMMPPMVGASVTTSSVASLNSVGIMPTVQSTPGSSPGNAISRIDLSRINMTKLSASTGMRGVYGIKGVALGPPSTTGSLIVSPKANVKLENGTQIILVVLH